MNPTYEIEKSESIPLLQAIRNKLTESGYKCRKFTGSNDGFYARHDRNYCRVYLKFNGDKVGISWNLECAPSDPLHQQGIDYMIESAIINFNMEVSA